MKHNIKKVSVILFLALAGFSVFAQGKRDALVLYNNRNFKEAIEVCDEEIKADPTHVDSYVVMCWALVGNREYARAEQVAYDGLKQSRYDMRLIEVLGEAGAGMVKITMSCHHVVKRVDLDKSLLGDDKEMLEDLIAAALNDAVRKVAEKSAEHLGQVTKGLKLPAGMENMFG